MRRIQIHIDDDMDEALALEALERGVSKAALIREYLAQHIGSRLGRRDAGQALIGSYAGDEDESSQIDQVVYRR